MGLVKGDKPAVKRPVQVGGIQLLQGLGIEAGHLKPIVPAKAVEHRAVGRRGDGERGVQVRRRLLFERLEAQIALAAQPQQAVWLVLEHSQIHALVGVFQHAAAHRAGNQDLGLVGIEVAVALDHSVVRMAEVIDGHLAAGRDDLHPLLVPVKPGDGLDLRGELQGLCQLQIRLVKHKDGAVAANQDQMVGIQRRMHPQRRFQQDLEAGHIRGGVVDKGDVRLAAVMREAQVIDTRRHIIIKLQVNIPVRVNVYPAQAPVDLERDLLPEGLFHDLARFGVHKEDRKRRVLAGVLLIGLLEGDGKIRAVV